MMRRIVVPVLAGLIAVGAGACASTGNGDSGGSRDEITSAELAELPNMSAYDAVRRLRPTWLSRRGQVSFRSNTTLVVVVNETLRGGVGELNSFQIRDVRSMHYMDAREATLRYGTEANGGAIVVEIAG